MREYLEATETAEEGQQAEFIRSDITGMTEQERADVQATMEDIMAGKSYRLVLHNCFHGEGKHCSTELVKEV
jgi:hypothetical protein